jgi:uncharacterized protein (TIGR02246 family)
MDASGKDVNEPTIVFSQSPRFLPSKPRIVNQHLLVEVVMNWRTVTMKKLNSIFAIILALAISGCTPQVDVEAERAAIHKFHDECLTAQLAGNVDCFAEDGQWFPPNAAPIKGKKAIGELVSQVIGDPNFSASHDIVNIEVSRNGNLAYIHYTYELSMSGPDGSPVTERGKAIHILKKQPEVGWEILIDIWNTDPPEVSGGDEEETDIVAIHGLFERYDSTVTAGQAEEWMSLFSDDIIWMNPDQPALVGKDAVRVSVEPLFADLDNEHISTVDEISVAGNWAFVRTTYTWRFTPKAGGETSELLGKQVFILMRQIDDNWRITRAIWNKTDPAPAQ